jgi:hypothetical protein
LIVSRAEFFKMPPACPAWVRFFHHEPGSPDDMQNFASGEAKFCNPFALQAANTPPRTCQRSGSRFDFQIWIGEKDVAGRGPK